MTKQRSAEPDVVPISRSGQMDDLHLVYADPGMGDPCSLMFGGSANWQMLDESHPDLAVEQEYLDGVIAARVLAVGQNGASDAAVGSDDADAGALIVGRVDLADGTRRYIGREDIDDANGTRLVVSWLSDEAEAFYCADRSYPERVIRKRVFRTEESRIVEILDERYHDRPDNITTVDATATTGQSRARRSRPRHA